MTILLALGSGPASFLPTRMDTASRIALAPLLGFCLGTCVTTTIVEFAPVNATYWVLFPVALGSAGVAAARTVGRREHRGPRVRPLIWDLAALLLIVVVVLGPIDATLQEHRSVGPATYTYTDADNYVAVQDAARTVSAGSAADAASAFQRGSNPRLLGNLTQFIWSSFAQYGSNLDAGPLDANVNALLDLGATDTYSPFLTVLLLMGALGAFAAVRSFARSPTRTATLAAALFGGAMFMELWFDSSQAAIVAIALVVPFLVLIDAALVQRGRSNLVLIALVLATMLTVYPLYIPFLIATAALMGGWRCIAVRRSGQPLKPLLRLSALSVAAVAVMAIAFDPVAVARDVHYYHMVLLGQVPYARVTYTLPIGVLPGWIAQTREFWALSGPGSGGVKQILLGVLLPLVFLGMIAIGVRRYPRALALVALGAVCSAAAEYTYLSQQSCTYCADRALLPLGPISAVLIALGVCALVSTSSRWSKAAGIVGIVVVAVPVAQRLRIERTRFSHGSYFLDSANRSVLGRIPRGGGAIEVEGYGSSVAAQAEQPLVYHLVNERAPGRASIVLGSDANNAIQYLDFGPVRLPPGPEFDPRYRYVLTRLAGVATSRRVVARRGAIALEERVKPLDITPYAGLGTPLESLDRSGVAWVQTQSPLRFYIAGYGGGHVWGRFTFRVTVPTSVPSQTGVRTRLVGSTLTACVPALGAAPERRVDLTITAALRPGPEPHESFPPPMPLEGVALTSMRAVTGRCTT